MKKLLLFMCMAVMAISANAQQKAVLSEALKLNVKNAKMVEKNAIKELDSPAAIKMAAIKGNKAEAASKIAGKKKSQASEDINGVYIQDDFTEFHACGEVSIEDSTTVWESEEGTETVTFNKFVVFANGYVEVPANYDETTGVLTIPGAVFCYDDKEYGRFALFCINDEGEITDEDLTFTYDELTNSFYLDQAGYYIYMYDYSQKMKVGQVWNTGNGTAFLPANGEMDYSILVDGLWEEDWCYIRVEEDVETKTITVYNYLNKCAIDHKVNDDYSVTIEKGQPMEMTYDEQDKPIIAGIYAMDFNADGKFKSFNWERDLDASLASVLQDEEGKLYLYKPGTEEFNVYGAQAIRSTENFVSGVAGLGYLGAYAIPVVFCYEPLQLGPEPAAIKNVEIKSSTSKATFNLAGQRVSNDYKGIVLKNGKKVIKK